MIKLTIELDGEFVLRHNDDLPMEKIVEMLKTAYGDAVAVENVQFTSAVVNIDGEVSETDCVAKIKELIAAAYDDGADCGLNVTHGEVDKKSDEPDKSAKPDGETHEKSEPVAEQPEEKPAVPQQSGETRPADGTYSAMLRDYNGQTSGDKPAPTVADIMKEIDSLVAADEFKALAHEIKTIAPTLLENGTKEALAHRSYLFSVNDGYGLTTCLELFAKLLEATGLRKFSSESVREIKLGPSGKGEESFEAVNKLLDTNRGNAQIVCVDISEWINNTDGAEFKRFLRKLDDCYDRYITVFRIPFVDRYILDKVRYSLNDLCFVSAVSFPPFNGDELRKCAQIHLKRYGLQMTPAAWKYFDRRVAEERSDGKFYGLRTVKKIMMELIYNKQLVNAVSGRKDGKIDAKTAAALCLQRAGDELGGYQMLERLVGSKAIVDRVNEIVAQIEVAMRAGGERPCIHMRFVGNPGTGKTTVARILGKILKEKGILRIGDFHECRGRDLCGMYVGQTAPKTSSICRDAYGSVLFIDEAYSLYRNGYGNDYGTEALDTLIAEMENHRTDFVVIMAGYTDEMKTLMEGNSGLASRMPYIIEFPNFTRDQLFDIYKSMLGDMYRADEKCLNAVREYINKLPDDFIKSKEFSNARFVRNLFERTTAKTALRMQLEGKRIGGMQRIAIIKDDFDRAVNDSEFKIDQPQHRIGFKP